MKTILQELDEDEFFFKHLIIGGRNIYNNVSYKCVGVHGLLYVHTICLIYFNQCNLIYKFIFIFIATYALFFYTIKHFFLFYLQSVMIFHSFKKNMLG